MKGSKPPESPLDRIFLKFFEANEINKIIKLNDFFTFSNFKRNFFGSGSVEDPFSRIRSRSQWVAPDGSKVQIQKLETLLLITAWLKTVDRILISN